MLISDTIRLFLDSIGRSEEYEYYLKKFRSDRSSCFAVLAPDALVCAQGGENMDVALQYLERLDLIPAVLLSGPRAEAMLAQLPRSAQTPGGYTIFRPSGAVPALTFGSDVPAKRNETSAMGRGSGAYDVQLTMELGAAVQSARLQKTSLVIVWPEAAFAPALEYLSRQLSARLYLVRMAGALRDRSGAPLLYYHYRNEHSRVDLAPEDGALAELATNLAESGNRLHMSVTAPYSLLKEIFTVKGAGTMIRPGSNIQRYDSADAVDRQRLLELLGHSFGKALADDAFLERAGAMYIEANYQGAIILERQPMGDYLSKFAVDKQARGIGIAQELWDLVIREHPRLFWRSRSHNSINRWYTSLADGTARAQPHWQVFWRGVALDDLPRIIRYCVERPEDFVSDVTPSGA